MLQQAEKEYDRMSELKKYKLGDLGFFFGGVTSIKKEDYGHGTPFLPYKNVYKNSKVNVNELELMNVRPLDLERRNAVYGDIFFTASSETPDEVAMSSVLLDEVENLTFNGFCKRFRLNDFNTLLPEYARYLFRDISFRREVYQLATGDIRFNISQESLANIEIEIPDTATQKEIAQILSSLDDKIELNLQMNQTLEAMAQAIFKEWFVNFNFTGFDGELVDGLPKGWRMVKLTDLLNTISITHKFPKGEAIFLNTSDILDGKFLHRNYSSKESLPGQAKKTIQKGDILFTEIRPANRRYAFVDFDADDYVVSTKLMVLRSKGLIDNLVIYYFMKSDEVLHQLQSLAESRSGTFPQITYDELAKVTMPLPDLTTQMAYTDFLWSVFGKVRENEKQIEYLTQTRDTLLPKLMSGQLEVV